MKFGTNAIKAAYEPMDATLASHDQANWEP
jgi:hypothetical protein